MQEPASARRVLLLASAASFLVYLDVTVVNVAFPEIEASFGDASRETLAWVLAAYNIVFAALLVPGGRIGDRFGRKRVFLIGLVVFALASAACAAATSAGLLIAARVLQAMGGALLVPASQGLVLEAYPHERRTTAMSMWVAAGAVAAALGPPLGGLLVESGSWRWVFLINLPIAAAVLVASIRSLRESREDGSAGFPDPLGIGLSALAVGALVLAIVQGDSWGWGSAETPRFSSGSRSTARSSPPFSS
jgi:multidrug resistance protein